MSSKQGFNPYLPSWEYIPDGEPHVFGDRVYLYGSHDRFNGYAFCLNDYVCYSAPVSDLTDWRCEGVIYTRADDPRNVDGDQCLYAPDVCRGADGRYYLYYVLDASPFVSVAVCDTPAGRYQFYGYVKDREGGVLGERAHELRDARAPERGERAGSPVAEHVEGRRGLGGRAVRVRPLAAPHLAELSDVVRHVEVDHGGDHRAVAPRRALAPGDRQAARHDAVPAVGVW